MLQTLIYYFLMCFSYSYFILCVSAGKHFIFCVSVVAITAYFANKKNNYEQMEQIGDEK